MIKFREVFFFNQSYVEFLFQNQKHIHNSRLSILYIFFQISRNNKIVIIEEEQIRNPWYSGSRCLAHDWRLEFVQKFVTQPVPRGKTDDQNVYILIKLVFSILRSTIFS